MSKRSDLMTKGPERAPHRSLLRADGFTDWEMERPMIGIANSFNEIIPGHMHLDKLVKAAIKPRDIMTKEAFYNTIAADMALGGSTRTETSSKLTFPLKR